MRFKTYLTTYLLFLLVLFACFGTVSAYITNSQFNMHIERSAGEFQTIAQTIFRDIAAVSSTHGRNNDFLQVSNIVNGYAVFYRRNNITLELVDLSFTDSNDDGMLISFLERNNEYFVHITGLIPEPFDYYQLIYYLNITEQVAAMRRIQNTLLLICIVFSVITAIVLYLILAGIFKPLVMVSKTSRKIANGQYGERIHIKGKNELSAMADDFNRMAEKIESEILGKQRFIDNFAHEIRTPLTSVYGNAFYMQKAVLDEEENTKLTQSIMNETNHMKNIANSLLQLATLRDYVPVRSQIDIQFLFEDIAQTLNKPLNESGIKLEYESNACVLDGQEDLIKSLLLNLCFNAIKACSSKIGVVSLKAEQQDNNISLYVIDNGIGIPEESIAKITEPFYRVDESRNRNNGGTGLGLTLCKQIADVHNADMQIDSVLGVGTTIKILFTHL